jgi:hypothetical protein
MLVNGCVASDARDERGLQRREKTAPERRSPLRRVPRALTAQGTVMVVPSPVAVMENVPAVLDV